MNMSNMGNGRSEKTIGIAIAIAMCDFYFFLDLPKLNINRRLLKRRVDTVDRNRVEWVRRIAAHVNNDAQSPLSATLFDEFGRQERWDLAREVDTVDKDIHVQYLLKRTPSGGFGHVPLEDVLSATRNKA